MFAQITVTVPENLAPYVAALAKELASAHKAPCTFRREEAEWLGMFADGLLTTDREIHEGILTAFGYWQAARNATNKADRARLFGLMYRAMFPPEEEVRAELDAELEAWAAATT